MKPTFKNFKALEHSANLVKSVQTLYSEEKFFDVKLIVEGKCMKAHKLVLSTASDFFRIIFNDCKLDKPILTMESFKFSEMKAVLEFMYTGKLKVSSDEFVTFLKMADLLKIKGVWEDSERISGGARFRRQKLDTSLESEDQTSSKQRLDFAFRATCLDLLSMPAARDYSRSRQTSKKSPLKRQDEPMYNKILDSASKRDCAGQSDDDKSTGAVSRQQNEQHQSTSRRGENPKSGHVVLIEHSLVDVTNGSYNHSRRDELCPTALETLDEITGPEGNDHSFQELNSNRQGIGEPTNLSPCIPKTDENGASAASCSLFSLEDSNLNRGSEPLVEGMDPSPVDSSEKNPAEEEIRPEEDGALGNEVPSRNSTSENGQENKELSNPREHNEVTTSKNQQQNENLDPEKLNRLRSSKRKVPKTTLEQDNAEVPQSTNVDQGRHKRRKLIQTEEPSTQCQNSSPTTENRAPYDCEKCRKSFSSMRSLSQHLRSACNNLRLFGCPYCEYRANYNPDLLKHVRRLHPDQEVKCIVHKPKTTQNEFQDGYSHKCQYCGKRFKYEESMARHSCSKLARNPGHLIGSTHKCEKCQTAYSSKSALIHHLKVFCDNLRPFGCPYCEFRANLKTNLEDHVKRVHPNKKVTWIVHEVAEFDS